MTWVHEISLAALAAAVVTLGLVILLELRSIAQLRRSVDAHLQRVFEQLDLLRFETQQRGEAVSAPVQRPPRLPAPQAPALQQALPARAPNIAPPTLSGALPKGSAAPRAASVEEDYGGGRALGAGETRLLASLAAARARLLRPTATAG
jgi:hypothetical protein